MDVAGTWVDLLDPTEDELEQHLQGALHGGARDQLLRPSAHGDEPRPKIESHGAYAYAVLLLPVLVPDEDRTYHQEIDLLLTADRVISVRKTPRDAAGQPSADPPYDPADLRRSVEKASDQRPGTIAYLISDDVAEAFLDLIDGIHFEIDQLEDEVENGRVDLLQLRISELRHDLLHIRQTLSPTRDAMRRVVDGRVDIENDGLFPHDIELHFGDVYDKFLRASEGLETARDLVGGVRDYLQAKVANDQNEVMKRLTVVASLLLLPTFIVGLYGQNFHDIPELRWRFGYVYSWLVILLTTVGQLVYFRRRRWI